MRRLLLSPSLCLIGLVACLPSKTSLVNAFGTMPNQEQQQWDVERYQKQHSFVWKYGASLLDSLVDDIHPGDCILDVGCGSGELTAELYKRAQEKMVQLLATTTGKQEAACPATTTTVQPITVIGMDASADMIATASKQYPHLEFFQGDVRNFELPGKKGEDDSNTDDDDDSSSSNKVNVIFSNAALHWIPPCDVDRAVGAMSRALVKEGRLVVEFGGKGNVEKIVLAAQHVLLTREQQQQRQLQLQQQHKEEEDDLYLTGRYEHGWYFPSISEFTSLLEKHGIEVTSAALFDRPTPLDDGIHGMSNWLRMFGSNLLSVPKQQQQHGDSNNATATAVTNPMGNSSNNHMNNIEQQDREQVIRQIHDELMRRGELWDGQQWTADYRRIRVTGKKK